MIPNSIVTTDLDISEEIETTRTYRLTTDKIQGITDKLESLQQAIYKVLNTEKYEYPIYSFSYGIELSSLIGKDRTYVKVELKRKIKECLLKDERIQTVDNFSFNISEDELICTFNVKSIYGDITINKEVTV